LAKIGPAVHGTIGLQSSKEIYASKIGLAREADALTYTTANVSPDRKSLYAVKGVRT